MYVSSNACAAARGLERADVCACVRVESGDVAMLEGRECRAQVLSAACASQLPLVQITPSPVRSCLTFCACDSSRVCVCVCLWPDAFSTCLTVVAASYRMAPSVSNNRGHVSPRIRELQARLLTTVPSVPPNFSVPSPPLVQKSEAATTDVYQENHGTISSSVERIAEQQFGQASQLHQKSKVETLSCLQSDFKILKSSASSQHQPVCVSTSCQTDSSSERPSSFSNLNSRKSSHSSYTDSSSRRPSTSSQPIETSSKSSLSSTPSKPFSESSQCRKYSSTTVSHSKSEHISTTSHVPVNNRVNTQTSSWTRSSTEHAPKVASQQYSACFFEEDDRSQSAVQRLSRYIDRLSLIDKRPERFSCQGCCGPDHSDLSVDLRLNQFKSLPNLDIIQRADQSSAKLNNISRTGNSAKQGEFLSRARRSNMARCDKSVLKRRTKSVVRFSRSADRPEKHCRSCSCSRSRHSNTPSLLEVDGCVVLCDNWLDSSKFASRESTSSHYVPPDLLDRFFDPGDCHRRLLHVEPTSRNLHSLPAEGRCHYRPPHSDKRRRVRVSRKAGDQNRRGVSHWFLWGQPPRHKLFGSLRRALNPSRIRPAVPMSKGCSDYRQRWNGSEKWSVFHRKHQVRRSRVRFEELCKPCCRPDMGDSVAPLAPLDHIDGVTLCSTQMKPNVPSPETGPHSLGSKLKYPAADEAERRTTEDFINETSFSAESFPPVCYRNRNRSAPSSGESAAVTWQSPSGSSDEGVTTNIPSGWEKHEDGDGAYFWHVKSGTIQREPPALALTPSEPPAQGASNGDSETSSGVSSGSATSGITRSCTSSALANTRRSHADHAEKRLSVPCFTSSSDIVRGGAVTTLPARFSVSSLGWCEVDEQCLTAEMSSRTVNRCIVDLAQGGGDCTADGVGRWGEGKSLVLELDEQCLRLLESTTMRVINSQPIHAIRVWGVGRDNTKDFAYVARDRVSRRHMCHVFRCDVPARIISNTLRDVCKQIMIERSLSQTMLAQRHAPSHTPFSERSATPGVVTRSNARKPRPTSLMLYDRQKTVPTSLTNLSLACSSFPTPQDEPSQVLTARYMGSVPVSRPSGIDVLNSALDVLLTVNTDARAAWPLVDITVSPSTITVRPHEPTLNGGAPLLECRVRFLSFLGIGREVEHCGVVVHTAHDVFVAHGFQCDTSAGPLCRAVETACQLRYQKCLDGGRSAGVGGASSSGQGGAWRRSRLGDTLRSVIGTLSGRQRVTTAET